jgi:hypothetical protein
MTVRFIGRCEPEHRAVTLRAVERARTVLALPSLIDVEFIASAGVHWWGATDLTPRHPGRIRLNRSVDVREIPLILAHELLHVEQIHGGRLRGISGGGILWCGAVYMDTDGLPWDQYCQLPWEEEAYSGQSRVLQAILCSTDS